MTVYSLSHHATYACRHSGACCTAGWTIPVEAERQALLGAVELPQPEGGACQFYDREARLCAVHRDHGEAAMPASCQHFPRRALIDDRGTFVTLSHFCPTAATMLFEATAPLTITTTPPAFPADRSWDGLDARGQWPPLLSPGVLFDLDTYTAFDQFIVSTLSGARSVDEALAVIAGAIERLRAWNQRRGSLLVWANDAFENASERGEVLVPGGAARRGALMMPRPARQQIYASVLRAVPPQHDPPALHATVEDTWRNLGAPAWSHYEHIVARYVASKAFGSWTAYQGRGARTLLAEMAVSAMVLQVEAARLCARLERGLDDEVMRDAIRAADWLLVHLVERQPFVDWLGEVEHL